jgi:hypothetical protein
MKFQLRRMQNFRDNNFHSNANLALWSAKPTHGVTARGISTVNRVPH